MASSGHSVFETLVELGLSQAGDERVRGIAKLRLLDYAGALADGVESRTADIFLGMLELVGGNAQATYFARNARTSILNAAAGNAAVGHAAETDDVHKDTTGYHPGVTIIPAVLSTAEYFGTSGEDILRAIVLGYEISGRIGAAITPSHRARGFHATGTIGTLGAAAGAAYAAGLDRAGIVSALGLATSMAGGTFGVLAGGAQGKHLHAAHAAMAGAYGALLSREGMGGAAGALEASGGFLEAYSDATNSVRLLAQSQRAEIERVLVKPLPCCAHAYGAIEAAIKLAGKAKAGEVAAIEVETYSAAAILSHVRPESAEEAKLSVPFCLAAALTDGELTSGNFTDAGRERVLASGLAERIRLIDSPASNALYPGQRHTRVTLVLVDGRRLVEESRIVRDAPDPRPLGEVVRAKFHAAAQPVYGAASAEIEALIMALDTTPEAATRLGIKLVPAMAQRNGAAGSGTTT